MESFYFLLVLALASYVGAITEPVAEEVLFSRDLNPDFTPCRQWIFPCIGGIPRCTTQEEYARFQFGPRPLCPELEDPTPVVPSGVCALVDGECSFTETSVPSCVSWLADCDQEYSCTTEATYEDRMNATCTVFDPPPPTPDEVCVPQDRECGRYNPCTIWQGHCLGAYNCGTRVDFGRFLAGPIPFCVFDPFRRPFHPEGECLYRDGRCEWSECTSWLDHCRTRWNCGSEYDLQVFNTLPVPPCPPPPSATTPPLPGVCQYNLTLGRCDFFQVECEGGREYTECGSLCPRTCDNIALSPFNQPLCPTVCVPGCFCPSGMVLHKDECIRPTLCPGVNPCDPNPCERNERCEIIEPELPCFSPPCAPPLGLCVPREPDPCDPDPCDAGLDCYPLDFPCDEPPCPPAFECVDFRPCDPSPCESGQQCVEQQVLCVRAPCPPVADCVDGVQLQIEPFQTGVRVTVRYEGARSIRVIIRDSNFRRHTQKGPGSSVSLVFQNLPSGVLRVKANVRTQGRQKISSEVVSFTLN